MDKSVDYRKRCGPFDIIGDVHGCYDELILLLKKLGYKIDLEEGRVLGHPEHRKIIFVGDLIDRGPKSPEVLNLIFKLINDKKGFCVMGNHDDKLRRHLKGNKVQLGKNLAETMNQIDAYENRSQGDFLDLLELLPIHMVLDQGRLVVVHGGIKAHYIGRTDSKVKAMCLYGQSTGKIDAYGLPERYPWARDYQGDALIVYGHAPVLSASWVNNTINIDTACVFGNKLTAYRYPEGVLVDQVALKSYAIPKRPPGH